MSIFDSEDVTEDNFWNAVVAKAADAKLELPTGWYDKPDGAIVKLCYIVAKLEFERGFEEGKREYKELGR